MAASESTKAKVAALLQRAEERKTGKSSSATVPQQTAREAYGDYVPLEWGKYYHFNTPQKQYQENQGILSVEADPLAFDQVAADSLAVDFDPLSPEASRRVASKYKNYSNIAMLPEEAAAFNVNLDAHREADQRAYDILKGYHGQFRQSLDARDSQEKTLFNQALGDISAAAASMRPGSVSMNVPMVNVRVVSGGSNIEATYNVPQAVADALAKQKNLYTTQTDEGFNVDVRMKGGEKIGQKLHDALRDAEIQTREKLAQSKSQAQAAAEAAAASAREDFKYGQYQGLVNAINESRTQRNIQVAAFDQEFTQGLDQYRQIGQQWGSYLNDKIVDQAKTKESTGKAIAQVAGSGILGYSLKRG